MDADTNFDLEDLVDLGLPRMPLVVLSACETGRANWRDSVARGLADYFVEAGAKAVVSTLWMVDDLATSLLMVNFYERLMDGGLGIAEALRESQLWLRELTKSDAEKLLAKHFGVKENLPSQPFESPMFWAPFLVTQNSK